MWSVNIPSQMSDPNLRVFCICMQEFLPAVLSQLHGPLCTPEPESPAQVPVDRESKYKSTIHSPSITLSPLYSNLQHLD